MELATREYASQKGRIIKAAQNGRLRLIAYVCYIFIFPSNRTHSRLMEDATSYMIIMLEYGTKPTSWIPYGQTRTAD